MPLPNPTQTADMGMARVIPIRPLDKSMRLRRMYRMTKKRNNELEAQNRLMRHIVRLAAQRYFAIDPNSQHYAVWYLREVKKYTGPITFAMVIQHWMDHGGPEGFAGAFGTDETLDLKKLLHVLSSSNGDVPVMPDA